MAQCGFSQSSWLWPACIKWSDPEQVSKEFFFQQSQDFLVLPAILVVVVMLRYIKDDSTGLCLATCQLSEDSFYRLLLQYGLSILYEIGLTLLIPQVVKSLNLPISYYHNNHHSTLDGENDESAIEEEAAMEGEAMPKGGSNSEIALRVTKSSVLKKTHDKISSGASSSFDFILSNWWLMCCVNGALYVALLQQINFAAGLF